MTAKEYFETNYLDKFDRDFFEICEQCRETKSGFIVYEYTSHTTSSLRDATPLNLEGNYNAGFSSEKDDCAKMYHRNSPLSLGEYPASQGEGCLDNACDTSSAKLQKILGYTNVASSARYLATNTAEVILANLIVQILSEIEGDGSLDENLIRALYNEENNLGLEEALETFEFYRNNPFREEAERRLAKLEQRRSR